MALPRRSKFGPKPRILLNFSDFFNAQSLANPHKTRRLSMGDLIRALFEPGENCNNELTQDQAKDLHSQWLSSALSGATSAKKAAASAANGKKGGRPKKKKE